ncbi:MAG: DNA-directed RNA polymerase subunit A'' [Candidatus Iainarchaeum archaeon]|uniref:DNA-directed RNA polymerase n=1 Tax=Candidatus Iainarchaeum sp. TaxID=3101447 RepID=A0A497JIV0_9ARCH|nr:MAG: DNA-directed RNA polymerase subunit A'' [Candidatus Diapherotrites archaeon]
MSKKKSKPKTTGEKFTDYLQKYGLPWNVLDFIFEIAEKERLTSAQLKKVVDEVRKIYSEIAAHCGEPAGMVAAQSLGEPGTQLTLRTKHYAGAAEVSVGSGIQRVEEIVDGRSKAKYPTMTIYLNEELRHDEKKADQFAKSLIDVRIEDVVEVDEDYAKKHVKIIMLKDKLKERNLDPDFVAAKIKQALGKRVYRRDYEISFSFEEPYLKIRKRILKMLRTRLQGVRGINKTLLVKENDEYVIKTSGTNLKAVLRLKEVDGTRTTTNDIMEISKVLGIEAGREAIVRELHKTLQENNILVDIKHIMLLADLMTYDGNIRGVIRTGITRGKPSPFTRAAFEETIKHLLEAAFKGEKEKLRGVVENIIVGRPIKVGTGMVELVMKLRRAKK